MGLVPSRDWMIVEPIMARSESKLELPDSVKDSWAAMEAMAFRVLQAGPGWLEGGEFHANLAKEGDIVILEGKLAVSKIKYDEKEYYIAQGRYVALKEGGNE